jgi:hypothetical protein
MPENSKENGGGEEHVLPPTTQSEGAVTGASSGAGGASNLWQGAWGWLFGGGLVSRYQIAVAGVLLITVITCGVCIYKGPDWRAESAIGKAQQPEYDSAMYSFLIGVGLPAGILIVTVLAIRGVSGGFWKEPVYRLQAWISLVAVVVVCLLLIEFLREIIVFADYEKATPETGRYLSYSETHPWEMRLVPRVQGLCTFITWMLTLALSCGLFPFQKVTVNKK